MKLYRAEQLEMSLLLLTTNMKADSGDIPYWIVSFCLVSLGSSGKVLLRYPAFTWWLYESGTSWQSSNRTRKGGRFGSGM